MTISHINKLYQPEKLLLYLRSYDVVKARILFFIWLFSNSQNLIELCFVFFLFCHKARLQVWIRQDHN